MSKQPVSPPEGGGLPPIGARGGADAAPSPSPPGTGRARKASAQGERQAATAGSLRDGAGTSAAVMAARGGDGRRATFRFTEQDGGQTQQVEPQYQRDGRNGDPPPATAPRGKPSYVPAAQRRRDQPPADLGQPYPPLGAGGFPEERQQSAVLPPRGEAPPPVAMPEGAELPTGGAPPPSTRPKRSGWVRRPSWAAGVPDPSSDARRHPRPGQQTSGEEAAPAGSLATPGVPPAPPHKGSATAPEAPPQQRRVGFGLGRNKTIDRNKTIERVSTLDKEAPPQGGSPTAVDGPPRRLPNAKTIERVSTLDDKRYGTGAAPAAPGRTPLPPLPPLSPSPPPPHGGGARPQQPTTLPPYHKPSSSYGGGNKKQQQQARPQPSPMQPTERWRRKEKKKQPLAILFTLCCILFWLLVVCIGLAILVIYLLYHPKPPRVHVSTATLNAGYIDELPPPHLGQLALNSDLYVLAAIYNPNTKIDVVLHYMQFDLYFQGHLIGTQAVWPPLYERPGDSYLRSVHLVVSERVMRPEEADVWRNATGGGGGLLELHLEGRWYVQLNFGRWLPFRYMVKPSCTLWLDPPPAGALRRARCHQ